MAAFSVIPSALPAEEVDDSISVAVVSASRALPQTPVSATLLKAGELRTGAISKSLPQALEMQPSVVSAAEGATGLGYTSLRVRGVGAYQTGVTLNGISLNDAESQEVFWVNLPSMSRFLGSAQLQRGLGTSTSGAGAFGAGVSMITGVSDEPFAGAEFSGGSFGTLCGALSCSTGLLRSGLYAEGAYSHSHSDGYVRDAPAYVRSLYLRTGWKNACNDISLLFLQGMQNTGITWTGIPFEIFPSDPQYNAAPGATDNFRQSHVQLHYRHWFPSGLVWNSVLNYTNGFGWYAYPFLSPEGRPLSDATKDVTDNDLVVLRTSLGGTFGHLSLSGGVYLSLYDCRHSGESATPPHWELSYFNSALKREADAWLRAEYALPAAVGLYADVQYRTLYYNMEFPDADVAGYADSRGFFNPRAGVSLDFGQYGSCYASVALGHREPARADILASRDVRPERMLDFEAGYSVAVGGFSGALTLFSMEYRDMLLETGDLNFEGYAIKSNFRKGWRRGAELSASWKMLPRLTLSGNASFSDNRYVSSDDADAVRILLSPSVVTSARAEAGLWKNALSSVSLKYVGDQQWDNSGRPDRVVPCYFVMDASVSQTFEIKAVRLSLSVDVTNLLDRNYYAYAYSGGVYPASPLAATLTLRAEL